MELTQTRYEIQDGIAEVTLFRPEKTENSSPVSVALSKALLWRGLAEENPQSVHLIDSRCFYWAAKGADAREGIQSFLEKRPPRFAMSVSADMPEFYPWWEAPTV